MNQCRSEKVEPSTMHFRCQLETGHGDDHHYFVPEDEDLVRKDRDALVLQIDAEKRLYVQNDTYLRDQLKEKDRLLGEAKKLFARWATSELSDIAFSGLMSGLFADNKQKQEHPNCNCGGFALTPESHRNYCNVTLTRVAGK